MKRKKDYDEAMNRARDWLKQAENDLLWTRNTFESGLWAQACFAAQQVAEKALKALVLSRGYEDVRSHSLLSIIKALEIDGELENMAKKLDQYYISARYPDAFYDGAPYEYFTENQAREALAFAERYIDVIKPELAEKEV